MNYPAPHMTRKRAEAALTHLLFFCTDDRLKHFTAEGLSKSYNVPLARVTAMLSQARERRQP